MKKKSSSSSLTDEEKSDATSIPIASNDKVTETVKSPFFIILFLTKWIEIIKYEQNERKIKITLVVENFRTAFYWTFLGVILLGMLLTNVFVKEDVHQLLTDVFGASNICANFDFPPATYILPFFWLFAVLHAITYDGLSIFRIWIAKEEEKISNRARWLLTVAHVYFAFSVMYFTMIFAVPPDHEAPESVIVHTAPYINLKISFCVIQAAVVWFGVEVAWKNMWVSRRIPRRVTILCWLHIILQSIFMIASNILLINSIAGELRWKEIEEVEVKTYTTSIPITSHDEVLKTIKREFVGNALWWEASNKVVQIVNNVCGNVGGFVLNILIPLFQSQYLSFKGSKNIHETHAIIVSITDNRKGKGKY